MCEEGLQKQILLLLARGDAMIKYMMGKHDRSCKVSIMACHDTGLLLKSLLHSRPKCATPEPPIELEAKVSLFIE